MELEKEIKKLNEEIANIRRDARIKIDDARCLKFEEFIGKYIPKTVYSVGFNTVSMPKCDVCNENREIVAYDAFGEKHFVPCKCQKKITRYYISEHELLKVEQILDYTKPYKYQYKIHYNWFLYFDVVNVGDILSDGKDFDLLDKDKGQHFRYKENAIKYLEYIKEQGCFVDGV